MIPIADDKIYDADPPYVTMGLIALNVLIYLFVQPRIPAVPRLDMIPPEIAGFYEHWAIVPSAIIRGEHLYTLVTAMFLHGGLAHLAGNMLYLWIFGDNIEHLLGRVRFLAFYLICGILASAIQILFFPGSEAWNLGASGAIAGVLGAYLARFPNSRVRVLLIFLWIHVTHVRASVLIAFWFVLQLWSGAGQMTMSANGDGGVAYWAHVGGFVAGFVLIRAARPGPRRPDPRVARP